MKMKYDAFDKNILNNWKNIRSKTHIGYSLLSSRETNSCPRMSWFVETTVQKSLTILILFVRLKDLS